MNEKYTLKINWKDAYAKMIDNELHLSQICSFIFVMLHDIPTKKETEKEKNK